LIAGSFEATLFIREKSGRERRYERALCLSGTVGCRTLTGRKRWVGAPGRPGENRESSIEKGRSVKRETDVVVETCCGDGGVGWFRPELFLVSSFYTRGLAGDGRFGWFIRG